MEELKSYIETIIALTTKHIAEDEKVTDAYLKEFYRGRLVIERNDLEVFKKISEMINKL